jgi:hypothetical protein
MGRRLIARTASAGDRRGSLLDEQQKQTIFDLPKVIAVGIAAPVATILTSRFGVTGTLIGLALSAVILTALADILKVYLARAPATVAKVPDTVVKMPGGLRTRLSWRNIRSKLRAAFARFSSLPSAPARRRSILIGSIVAAGISFLVGLSIVTGLELGVGKSLSCWVWDECPTESSTDDGGTSVTSTLPSILGGGQSASSAALEVQPPSPQQPTPASPQQPTPGTPGTPSQPEGVQGSEQQPSSPQPGQQWSQSGIQEEGDQQPSSSEGSEEDEQQNPVSGSEGDQQQEDQKEQPSSRSDRETREPAIPSVPFST